MDFTYYFIFPNAQIGYSTFQFMGYDSNNAIIIELFNFTSPSFIFWI